MTVDLSTLDNLHEAFKSKLQQDINVYNIDCDKVNCIISMQFFFEKNSELIMNIETDEPLSVAYFASGSL